MQLTTQTINEILKSKKLSDYHIVDKDDKLDHFKKTLSKYKTTIMQKIQDTKSEINQIPVFNELLSSIYQYELEIDIDKIDISIWDNLKLKVIIEAKRESNKGEMIKDNDINKKALHEALLYYYEQREKNVFTVNYIMITDYTTIYLFNAKEFENLIDNKTIYNLLSGYKNDELLLIQRTKELYEELARILNNIDTSLKACKIELFDENLDIENTYRILDRYNLLQTPLENDANELNKEFYQELLHIMGLQEKDNKLLKSTIKNTLLDLTESKIGKEKKGDELFETALGLNILWLNRILFLKILESQLRVFRNDPDFHILDSEQITDYYSLSKLFFSILSTPRAKRHEDDVECDTIPYLNSSLFEETELEKKPNYRISDLDMKRPLKIKSDSVLYNDKDFKKKELSLLEYLLCFLNCFSYNSDSDSVDKNTLIKSSVLGTVFERLNGYKDGSHFTPASITMYMSEKVLQKRIIDIFNKEFTKEFEDFEELISYVKKNFNKKEDTEKAQALVDNMTIIDPAVGSGHFLVSSLNELIKIKSQLGLLHKDIKVSIDNDELIIKSSFGDNFVYERREGKISKERQEIQKAIFDTKKHIIENQLYGVDINPNSVNICRLRLWIELLKHTYYTDKDYINLEVLPNLEFKVITANSLIPAPDIVMLFQKKDKEKLKILLQKYYNSKNLEKQHIKTEAIDLINHFKDSSDVAIIKTYEPFNTTTPCHFFDSSLMFGIEKFDIVIGNPPYIGNKDTSTPMMSLYESYYKERDDLYNYFYRRGFEFLKDDGILGYITSNTFLTIQSKKKLRKFLQSKQLLEMRLVYNVFEHAEVEPVIVIAQNTNEITSYQFNYVDNRNQEILYEGNNILIDINTYREAPNQVFFTPNIYNLAIANKYFGNIESLLTVWWESISTSKNIQTQKTHIERYRQALKAGDVTLLGLITDGGQGLATANNSFYIGVRESNKDSERTYQQRIEKIAEFNKEFSTTHDITKMTELKIRVLFRALFEILKEKNKTTVFGQGFLYQIISDDEIADVHTLTQNEKDNGIKGKRSFVPYDKGDKDGNRWYMPTSYCINWSIENVAFLKLNSGKKGKGMPVVRNPQFHFREGFCWNLINGDKNTNDLKIKVKEVSINDVGGMALYNMCIHTTNKYLIVLLNSDFISRYTEKFINFTINFQINNMRQVPIIIPTPKQLKQAEKLFDRAKAIKDRQIQNLITKDIADEQLATLQNEVDDFVYALYGLSEEEIEIVENR